MRKEYSFKEGVRGKHYKEYRKEHTVKVHQKDGTVFVQHFTLEDGAVMLDPDIKKKFRNSSAVNKALRSLLAFS